ncbi:MAG: Shedu immune nuclease family protein [Gemmataceae bacterium]
MSRNLEAVTFEPRRFEKELKAFGSLLGSGEDLSEAADIQPFFEKSRHLSAYLGTFSPNIGPATELAFRYPFFGDFAADLLLGSKKAGEFCVVEFEDGRRDSVFKKQPKRGNPEWSSRFEHGFSQLVDWFYNLDDFKGTKGFARTFGGGHVRFTGLLLIGRSAPLDEAKRNRLKWRTEKVLIDSHPVNCITFDELHDLLRARFVLYQAASKLERQANTRG